MRRDNKELRASSHLKGLNPDYRYQDNAFPIRICSQSLAHESGKCVQCKTK